MRFTARWLSGVIVLAVCAAGPVASSSAATRQAAAPITAGSRYLALGDSVTFGYEEGGVVPAPDYHNASTFPGYPEQLGAELHLSVANAACPGETSSSLINASAASNGCENLPGGGATGYRKLYPLHAHYRGSQLAYGLSYLQAHHNVRLVSLMIGANDYFLCVETTHDSCASTSERNAVLSKLAGNVRRILSAIRTKAHYTGQLAIVNYYSLNYAVPATNAQSELLNRTVDGAAKPFHVVIGDGFAEFKAATHEFGGSPCNAGLLTQLGAAGKCGIHPSFAGQTLLASALGQAIRL